MWWILISAVTEYSLLFVMATITRRKMATSSKSSQNGFTNMTSSVYISGLTYLSLVIVGKFIYRIHGPSVWTRAQHVWTVKALMCSLANTTAACTTGEYNRERETDRQIQREGKWESVCVRDRGGRSVCEHAGGTWQVEVKITLSSSAHSEDLSKSSMIHAELAGNPLAFIWDATRLSALTL